MQKKKNMKKLASAVVAVSAAVSLTSCASIVSGGAPKITIDGNTKEPVTITTQKQVYTNVTLPAVVKVRRHAIDGQRVQINSENYTYKDIVLEKKTNSWAFGNILLGGIPGWLIDLATNAVSMPQQKHYYIEAQPKTETNKGE